MYLVDDPYHHSRSLHAKREPLAQLTSKNEVVEKMTKKAKTMIRTLFDSYMSEDVKINNNLDFEKELDSTKKARKIADYIVGMNDR